MWPNQQELYGNITHLKIWQITKSQIMPKLEHFKLWQQKYSICGKIQRLKLWQNSTTLVISVYTNKYLLVRLHLNKIKVSDGPVAKKNMYVMKPLFWWNKVVNQNKGFISQKICRHWAVRNPTGTRLDFLALEIISL